MKKKFMGLKMMLAFVMLSLVLSACGEDKIIDNESDARMGDLLVASYNEEGNIGVKNLKVDFDHFNLSLSDQEIYTVENGPSPSEGYNPTISFAEKVILYKEPLKGEPGAYAVADDINKIYYDQFSLEYSSKRSSASLYEDGQLVGELAELKYEGRKLRPISFYVKEKDIAVLCQGENPDKFGLLTVSFQGKWDGNGYKVTEFQDFTSMYSDELSELQMPDYYGFSTNVYSDSNCEKFFWNEGWNIVEIDPKTGEQNILLAKQQLRRDFQRFGIDTEGYTFFYGFGYRNGVYTFMFPNIGGKYGEAAAYYDSDMNPLGFVLAIKDDETIGIYDAQAELQKEIKVDGLIEMVDVRQ